jgi:hypothetical protein
MLSPLATYDIWRPWGKKCWVLPVKVLSLIWITWSWDIWVCHNLKFEELWSLGKNITEYLDLTLKCLTANQCKERPQVTPLNLYSWFRYNWWWVYLVAIEDKFVWVVGHYHLHTWVKGVENFTNHPTDYEWLDRPRHGWRCRYLYSAEQMLWLNAAS